MPKKQPTLAQLRALLDALAPVLSEQVVLLKDRDDTRSADKFRGAAVLTASLLDHLDGALAVEDVLRIFSLVSLRLDSQDATNDPTPDAPSHAQEEAGRPTA